MLVANRSDDLYVHYQHSAENSLWQLGIEMPDEIKALMARGWLGLWGAVLESSSVNVEKVVLFKSDDHTPNSACELVALSGLPKLPKVFSTDLETIISDAEIKRMAHVAQTNLNKGGGGDEFKVTLKRTIGSLREIGTNHQLVDLTSNARSSIKGSANIGGRSSTNVRGQMSEMAFKTELLQEATILAKLRHPNTVMFYGVSTPTQARESADVRLSQQGCSMAVHCAAATVVVTHIVAIDFTVIRPYC
jgi:hypothetical protein